MFTHSFSNLQLPRGLHTPLPAAEYLTVLYFILAFGDAKKYTNKFTWIAKSILSDKQGIFKLKRN